MRRARARSFPKPAHKAREPAIGGALSIKRFCRARSHPAFAAAPSLSARRAPTHADRAIAAPARSLSLSARAAQETRPRSNEKQPLCALEPTQRRPTALSAQRRAARAMATQDLRRVYLHIVDDVIAKMKPEFVNEGVDE